MSSLDSLPEPAAGVTKAYERASVHRFLELAETERVRLDAALVVAHERRERAEAALAEAAEESNRVAVSLRSVTRDLAAERDTAERTIAVILAAADAEAEAILADAREEAAVIRALLPDERELADDSEPVPALDRSTHPAAAPPSAAEERWLGPRLVG